MSFFGNIEGALKGGLLWQPIKKATGLTDAQMIGIGAMAVGAPYAMAGGSSMSGGLLNFGGSQAAAPIVDASTAASPETIAAMKAAPAASTGGGWQTAGNIAGAVNQSGVLGNKSQPMQAPPAQFQQGQGFAGLLSPTDQVDMEKRRQAQQMAVQGLLGGYRG